MTFEEYERFVAATRGEQPADEDWGRGRLPVINVSWNDAKAYVEWLAAETDQPYRLLSEAEWEYACRVGRTFRYWWGEEITPENANYGSNVGKTSDVGSYPPNPWDLYDMNGNVWEWVEDCWNDSYGGAPDDGRAWTTGDCGYRVPRGGSWADNPVDLRSASRYRSEPDLRYDDVGFRVARTLSLRWRNLAVRRDLWPAPPWSICRAVCPDHGESRWPTERTRAKSQNQGRDGSASPQMSASTSTARPRRRVPAGA